jgi:hypothetical protein
MYDSKDPTAATPETRQKSQLALPPPFNKSLEGLRVGIPQVSHANSILGILPLRVRQKPHPFLPLYHLRSQRQRSVHYTSLAALDFVCP